jgi:glutamate-ammonia-ligase adenylyltransferase
VAYDYFSEFATFCGVLASFGLDIREAAIFTSREIAARSKPTTVTGKKLSPWKGASPKRQPGGLSRKIVVDVFRVQALKSFSFNASAQQAFHQHLTSLLRLLQKNHVRQARREVNRRLIEQLGKTKKKTGDMLHPVHVTFSNPSSSPDTVLDIRSTDTPAFLYAFANALAMRGIYLVKAKIEVKDHQVLNRLYVRGRHGRKLQSQTEQQELRTAAALLKEFTYYLSWAPDPGKALDHFDQFLDQLFEQPQKASTLSTLGQASTLEHLAQLFGSSDYLWEDLLRRQHDNLLPMMHQFQKGPLVRSKRVLNTTLQKRLQQAKTIAKKKQHLNQFKDEELFRIDMRHLLETSSLPNFSHALTNLADVIIEQALEHSYLAIQPKASQTRIPSMAIFGLGKLGGGELGYASDIEILFVYANPTSSKTKQASTLSTDFYERWSQEFLQWIEAKQEGIFHIDTRLRPNGDKGTLTNSLEEIQQYYDENHDNFPLKQNIIRGKFIRLPKDAPNSTKIRTLIYSSRESKMEELRTYCFSYALMYSLEDSVWINFDDIIKNTPLAEIPNKVDFLKRTKYTESSDENSKYYLRIVDYKKTDDIAPLEVVRDRIIDIIINKRKVELARNLEKEVYEKAVETRSFEIY